MDQVRDGSAVAFEALLERLWAPLVRFAAWELGDADAARDVVQDSFMYVWRNRHGWRSLGSPRAYLFKIVRNGILDERRRGRTREKWSRRETLRPRSSPPDPAQELEAREAERAFEAALASLPPRRREVFDLVVLRGLSYREAAEVLEVSEQTVANQVSTALRHIRGVLGL